VPATLQAIRRLAEGGRLTREEAQVVLSGHEFLTRLRQSLSLMRTDGSWDVLPVDDGRLARAAARAVGCEDAGSLRSTYLGHTRPVREIFLRHVG
jgi:glutamine synthetase adenylyltransferase